MAIVSNSTAFGKMSLHHETGVHATLNQKFVLQISLDDKIVNLETENSLTHVVSRITLDREQSSFLVHARAEMY